MKTTKRTLAILLSAIIVLSMLTMSVFAAPASGKDLAVYYPNWSSYSDVHQNQYVNDLPWNKLTTINHAFWAIVPKTESGVTTYPIESTDAWADLQMTNNHFDSYAAKHAAYPNVAIMLSIGGWTRCGYFSEMASTQSGRASFIQSCIDTMTTYPFLGGIDIDWEYPGEQRAPEEAGDQGCPASPDDGDNYLLLLEEMRAAFDAVGMTSKQISVCAPANPKKIVTSGGQINQHLSDIADIVNRINIMTYDLTGSFDSKTGHQSNLTPNVALGTEFSIMDTVNFFIGKGVPMNKMNIGSPLYSRGWGDVVADSADEALGAAGSATNRGMWDGSTPGGQNPWFKVKQWEISDGWETGYDTAADAAYIYNNNPDSKYYQNFYTYENERSLQAKLDFINTLGLGGMIVWDSSGDRVDANYPMLSQMAKELGIWNGTVPTYTPSEQDTGVEETTITWPETVYEWYVGMPTIVKDQIVYFNGNLYQCNVTETYAYSENWNPTAWEAPNYNLVGPISEWKTDLGAIAKGTLFYFNGSIYEAIADTESYGDPGWGPEGWNSTSYEKRSNIVFHAPPPPAAVAAPVGYWQDDVIWHPGDIAIYNGKIYPCIAATHIGGGEHPETTWGYWGPSIGNEEDLLTVAAASIPAWDDTRIWPVGAVVSYNGKTYECIANTTLGSNQTPANTTYWKEWGVSPPDPIAAPVGYWQDGVVWNPGDYAIYNGKVYQCIVKTHLGGGEHPETTWGYWSAPIATEAFVPPMGDIGALPISVWLDNRVWPVGAVVHYQGFYYVCIADTTVGSNQNPTSRLFWKEWDVPLPYDDSERYVGYWNDSVDWMSGDLAIFNGRVYVCVITGSGDPETGDGFWLDFGWSEEEFLQAIALGAFPLQPWNDEREWPAGALVEFEGEFFKCIQDTTAKQDPTDTDYWEKLDIEVPAYDPYVGYWNDAVVWKEGDLAIFEGIVYYCIIPGEGDPVSGTGFWIDLGTEEEFLEAVKEGYYPLPEWTDEKDWFVGALVSFDGKAYVCIQNTSAGDGIDPANPEYWELLFSVTPPPPPLGVNEPLTMVLVTVMFGLVLLTIAKRRKYEAQ